MIPREVRDPQEQYAQQQMQSADHDAAKNQALFGSNEGVSLYIKLKQQERSMFHNIAIFRQCFQFLLLVTRHKPGAQLLPLWVSGVRPLAYAVV